MCVGSEVTCPVPPAVPNAMYHFEPFSGLGTLGLEQEGQTVRYTCVKGYEMVDDSMEPVLTCRNGEWEGPIPTCGKIPVKFCFYINLN